MIEFALENRENFVENGEKACPWLVKCLNCVVKG